MELAYFSVSRLIHLENPSQRRRDYIEALEQADRDPPVFRFLDLPAEMVGFAAHISRSLC